MNTGTAIVDIKARQVYSNRGHPGVETTVTTENGATGVAVVTAGVSVGTHEVQFNYDENIGWLGLDWKGKGVASAVHAVEEIIAPKIIGMDSAAQRHVDGVILEMDDTPMKTRLGGNATASVSAAVLKAGAMALGIPLYQHIGGTNACILPVPVFWRSLEAGATGPERDPAVSRATLSTATALTRSPTRPTRHGGCSTVGAICSTKNCTLIPDPRNTPLCPAGW